jgi:hypothetical protein
MARTILGRGAGGDLVRNVQQALVNAGYNTNGIDGKYGNGTTSAVSAFQTAQNLPATGTVDDVTWQALMNAPIPSTTLRSLQLTASFEGQGYTLAVGNFDGALLTWGIVGFTLSGGEIPKIINAVNLSDPSLVRQAFGTDAESLLQMLAADVATQTAWANQYSIMPGGTLCEPWKACFATFGSYPAVQQAQITQVQTMYMAPAVETASRLGLTSELGLALCFDIHVQDGGIKPQALASIQSQQTPGMAESDLLPIIANAVADLASERWQNAVRARKMAIATGSGTVNGMPYTLDNWGLNIAYQASELVAS